MEGYINAKTQCESQNKMSLYIVLMKFTQKGIESIRDQPRRFKESQKAAEKFGCKILGHLYDGKL